MIGRWSNWKTFPDAHRGQSIEAPIGPGVYEVCHASTGELVAFGSSKNVAEALSRIAAPANGGIWPLFRRAGRARYPSNELEYRTCPAGTFAEAKVAADQLAAHRESIWRRRGATL